MFAVLAFSGGKRVVATVLGLSLVQLIDTSDPWRWRVIQVGLGRVGSGRVGRGALAGRAGVGLLTIGWHQTNTASHASSTAHASVDCWPAP